METEEIYYNGYEDRYKEKINNLIENLKKEITQSYKEIIINLIKQNCDIEAQKKTKYYLEIMNFFENETKFEDD